MHGIPGKLAAIADLSTDGFRTVILNTGNAHAILSQPMSERPLILSARVFRAPVSAGHDRIHQVMLMLLVIIFGLFLRSRFCPAPPVLEKYGGDALWSVVVFLGLGFLFPRAATFTLALSALTISWAVEFSQLYRAPWLDAVRATLPGKLILGNTFNLPDLPAYAFGVAAAAMAELFRTSRRG